MFYSHEFKPVKLKILLPHFFTEKLWQTQLLVFYRKFHRLFYFSFFFYTVYNLTLLIFRTSSFPRSFQETSVFIHACNDRIYRKEEDKEEKLSNREFKIFFSSQSVQYKKIHYNIK